MRESHDTGSGEVCFVDGRESVLGTEVGWVYALVGDPGGGYGDFSSEPIAGPWHRYTYSPW